MSDTARMKKLELVEKLMGNRWLLVPKNESDATIFKHCTNGEHGIWQSDLDKLQSMFNAHNLIAVKVS